MENNVLIQEMNRYQIDNIDDIKNALREVGQKIVLSGLARGNIFDCAVFYDGTSLRILHNLDRFSEDIDFTLYKNCDSFNLENYLVYAQKELESFGLNASYQVKNKSFDTSVITGYIKFNLLDAVNLIYPNKNFKINKEENISIKVEVETKFYEDYKLEYRTILFPSYFKALTFDLSTLFSCKLLAILKRNWKSRVKGRDYFDFLFYMTNQIVPNYKFLSNGLGLNSLDENTLKELLIAKFNTIDFKSALNDVLPFIKNDSRFIELFNKEIFIDIVKEIK